MNPDIVIIGSGMGGATIAAGLAGSGAKITILEKGQRLLTSPETRDARAIFQRGHFRPKEMWRDAEGGPFNPGNYHVVGGNTKFYGAVLFRYRKEDFAELEFPGGGVSPAWPFAYDELEPWYAKAEQLYQVRGTTDEDPTEPFHSRPYPFKPVPDEPAIARVRKRLESVGLHPASLPLGVDIDRWLARARTRFDAYPDTLTGKMDAESAPLAAALGDGDITLMTGAHVGHLELAPDGRTIAAVHYRHDGQSTKVSPKLVILSAGAIMSSVILQRSPSPKGNGIANSSGQVGRNFMNHNSVAMLAIDPRRRNDSVYQKTLMLNDYYLSGGSGGMPLGNVQLLGKVDGNVLAANVEAGAALRARLDGGAFGGLVARQRGPARPRKPGHGRWRRDRAAVAALQHAGIRRVEDHHARQPAGVGLSDRADAADRQAHAVAPVRHRQDGGRSSHGSARCLLPLLRPPQPVRGRCRLHAEFGGGQSGAHRRGAGAARRRSHPPYRLGLNAPREALQPRFFLAACVDTFSATAARISALKAFSSIFVALVDVDGAADVAVEAGVEEARRVVSDGALGEGQLHHRSCRSRRCR